MQALYLSQGQLNYIPDYPQPKPANGQALIRILKAGICATDLALIAGYADFTGVLGHEFVGLVEAAPTNPDWVGRRVVGSINMGCSQCDICQQHGPEHCAQRTVPGIHHWDGAFADYLLLPITNLHEVPDDIANEAAVFTEPLAAALRIRQQVRLQPGRETAVIGPGRLGLLIGQVLALDGTDVVILGRRTNSLNLPQQLGLKTALTTDIEARRFDLVVDATGNEAGFAQALRIIRPLGTLILKSTFASLATVNMTHIMVNELTIIGSRCGPFAPALRLLAQNKIHVTPLIAAEYTLADGQAALTHAAKPGVRKILLRP